MRISDWSSDVCSSDLTNCGAGSSRRTCAEREAPPPWPCVCLRAEDRGAAAAVGAHPAAVHARGVEGHHDVAGAVERDRAAVAAQSGPDTQDHVVGRSLERGAALFHPPGEVGGPGTGEEE